MKKAIFMVIAVLLILPLTVYSKKVKRGFFFIPTVDVYKIKIEKKIKYPLEFPATLKSYDECLVRAQVSGNIIKKFFKEGNPVKKGQLLFEIDPSVYEAEVNSLKAQLKLAKAKLEEAKITYSRIEKSYKEHLVSSQQKDNSYFALKQAEANVAIVKANLKKALIYLNYAFIKAPISGFTSEKLEDVGNYITVGTPLVKIIKTNPIYAEFSIADNEFLKFKKEIKAGMKVNIIHKPPIFGKLDFVSHSIDKNTATVKLRAIFKNRFNILMPNEFVRVKLDGIYYSNVALIPQTVVIQTQRFPMVYIIKKDIITPKPIKIIAQLGKFFIVKGLKNGELIAYDNLMRIRPKMKVKIGKIVNK